MNILCLDQFSDLGGAQRCLLDLLPGMLARGWRVHLAAPGSGPLHQRAAALHVTVDSIPCGPYSSGKKTLWDMARFAAGTPHLARQIRRLATRHHADLVYVNGPRLLPAVALAARSGPPVLFHSHSLLDGLALRLAGGSLNMARAAVVAACNFVAAPLRPYTRVAGVRVIYNGVRRISLPARQPPADQFRIGVIGRISPEKGQADFLRAARILHPVAPQCRFLICGAPLFSDPAAIEYDAHLEQLAAGLPVEFLGWTEDVENVLAYLDLLLVPSAPRDATPRVILEGFAAGVPVMAFAAGGIPEIIQPGVTGFLVPDSSPQALAAAIRELLPQPQRLRGVADRARAAAAGEFSLERYRHQIVEAIDAAIGPRRA